MLRGGLNFYLLVLPANHVQIFIMLSEGLAAYHVAGSGAICMKYCSARGHELPFVDLVARYLILIQHMFPSHANWRFLH